VAHIAWYAIAITCGSMLAITLVNASMQSRVLLPAVVRLDPRFEGSLHTWLGSTLLAACAVTLVLIVQRLGPQDRFRRQWLILAAGFAAMSIDEIVQVHESLAVVSRFILGPSSSANFWTLIGLGGVAAVGLSFREFLHALPGVVRRRFLRAAAVYLGGAVGLELIGGVYEAAVGTPEVGYVLLATLEETLELAGAGMFLAAVLDSLEANRGHISALQPRDDAACTL
jgi:hypothetical protein